MRIPSTLAVLTLLAVAGCGSEDKSSGGSSAGGTSKATSATKVDIKEFKYGPEAIEVKRGAKVSFTNEDSAKHTATSKPQGAFDSGDISKGQTKPVTFDKAGTFNYFCVYHPTMAGKVTVK
jgi:plastocyanin